MVYEMAYTRSKVKDPPWRVFFSYLELKEGGGITYEKGIYI